MLFQLGRVVITRTAKEALGELDVVLALRRHASGDWGALDEHDRGVNDEALETGGRLLSAYADSTRTAFWIITEHDRSVTTILLPEDY